jgi:flavin-dependent dehydrogenase
MLPATADVAIVGAGDAALCAALAAAEHGVSVLVLERAPERAKGVRCAPMARSPSKASGLRALLPTSTPRPISWVGTRASRASTRA